MCMKLVSSVDPSGQSEANSLGQTSVVVVPAALAVALKLELVDLLDLLNDAYCRKR